MIWRHASGNLEVLPRYADGEMLTRLMHNIHEGGHACSPFNPANSAYFGGETGRMRAVAYIRAVARQCKLTGIYFNEYHTKLAEKLKRNSIDDACFEEETWAILLEQSLAAPFSSWLAQTETSQRKELAKLRRLYPKDSYPEAVELYLNLQDDKPRGIGAHLTAGMLYGVHDQTSLKQHIRWLNDARRKDLKVYETRGDAFERAVGRLATFCATLSIAIGRARTS